MSGLLLMSGLSRYGSGAIPIFSKDVERNNNCVNCNKNVVCRGFVNPLFGTKRIISKCEIVDMNIQQLKKYNVFKELTDIELKYILDFITDDKNHNEQGISYYVCLQCNSLFRTHYKINYKMFGITYSGKNGFEQYT